jgi:hypothetical protein
VSRASSGSYGDGLGSQDALDDRIRSKILPFLLGVQVEIDPPSKGGLHALDRQNEIGDRQVADHHEVDVTVRSLCSSGDGSEHECQLYLIVEWAQLFRNYVSQPERLDADRAEIRIDGVTRVRGIEALVPAYRQGDYPCLLEMIEYTLPGAGSGAADGDELIGSVRSFWMKEERTQHSLLPVGEHEVDYRQG